MMKPKWCLVMRRADIIQDVKKMVSSFNKSRVQPFIYFCLLGEKRVELEEFSVLFSFFFSF